MDGDVRFNIGANTAQFDAKMAGVGNVANTTANKIKTAFAGVGSMLVGGALVAGLKSLMNDFDRVGKLATRFGTSAESIQRVGVAADVAGTNVEQVANAMTKAGIAASKAVENGGEMAELFQRAGINARSFAAANIDQKLLMIAEAYRAAGSDASKTNAIIEIMGSRSGANLIPLISNVEALRAEMEGVAVASDDVVRKIEAANDRMTRLGNDVKVFFADMLQGFTDTSERIGSILAQANGLFKLLDAGAKALRGNLVPLTELMATSKTIKEMEEIEARASAIVQLTNEGVFGMDAVRNAQLIAERTAQILEQTRGTAQQIQIAEDSTDRVLGLEREKTAELDRQQQALERQEEHRQRAIRSIEQEIRLMEAQLSGNKELEESLRHQADFDATMEKTGSFETASNFAATKAAERQAQLAAALTDESSAGGGGGRSMAPRADAPSQDQTVAKMRAGAARNRRMGRFDELMDAGQFRSAARVQEAAERAANRIMASQRERDVMRNTFGAGNIGEALRNFERDARKAGMTPDEALGRMGIDRKVGEDRADALERFVKEQAKPETERLAEALAAQEGEGGESGKGGGGNDLQDLLAKLKEYIVDGDRLPQNAMS